MPTSSIACRRRRALLPATVALVSSFGLGSVPVFADPPQPDQADCLEFGCGKAYGFWLRQQAGLQCGEDGPGGPFGPREALGATDVLHNNLDIEVFPATDRITGSNTMTIRSLADDLSEFTFRLRSNYTITEAVINGSINVNPATIVPVGTYGRRITLDRVYPADEVFTLRIGYTGIAESRGLGSIEFDTQDGQPMIFSLSEPYFAGTWWPCKDGDFGEGGDNDDKATLEFAITAPNTLRSTSNGLLVGVDDLSGNRRRYRWASNYPLPTYLVAFGTTNYNTWTVPYNYPGGSMPVEFHIYPSDDTPGNRAAWERVVTMLDTFRPLYGLYPFIDEKYGIYEFEYGGGMEHQTNTGQGTFVEWISAHELGHQWWGDNVTCRTWHDIWLNEGFATYSEALWAEFAPGSPGTSALHNWMAGRRPTSPDGTVYVYDAEDYNRMFSSNYTYRKAGWVLHMLRHVVGDATFFNILAEYRATFEHGGATTDDFRTVASLVSGRDLTGYFDQWVYQTGAPSYKYGYQVATINGHAYLKLHVRQGQNPAWPTFVMPVDVQTYAGGVPTNYSIWNDARLEHFVIPLAGPIDVMYLDPLNWILTVDKTAEPYQNGPPKIVEAVPAPNTTVPAAPPVTQAAITFSEDVTVSTTDFTVSGPGGVVPFTLSYAPASFTATLSFAAALPAGSYAVIVNDSIRSTAANIQLDGEIGNSPLVLPSGEGLPGGSGAIAFIVEGPCATDFNGDQHTDLSDLATLLSNFGISSGATHAQGDTDADGDIDLTDLAGVLSAFGGECP